MKKINPKTGLNTRSPKKDRTPVDKFNKNAKPRDLIENSNTNFTDVERFKLLVQYSSDIITVLDQKQRITYQSPSITGRLGYKPEDIIGKKFLASQFIYKQDIAVHKKFIADTYKSIKSPIIITLRLRHKDGSGQYFEAVGVNCLSNPVLKGIIITLRDVDSRTQIEKRKDEFITVASHELKTPIATIKTFAQILEKRLRNTKNKKNSYFIVNINKHLDKLALLVDDLLDVTRIESGKLVFHKKSFLLDELIHGVIVDFQYTNDTHQIVKRGEFGKEVYGDEDRIAQVLVNLIANAVKYSPNGEKIIVHVRQASKEVVIGVEDFGPGIAKAEQEKIFERFYRTSNDSTASGFGLGLYIAYEIITRHNGKIWVESKRGKGSTFYFSLPL